MYSISKRVLILENYYIKMNVKTLINTFLRY